jgi:ubiquinol-cytochrome c reductase iron-sulfur subunit
MSSDDADNSRRRFLTAATVVVGAVGTVAVAVPFLGSWSPSARAKSAGAPVEANIGKLEPGQQIIVKWRGMPVWVVRRDEMRWQLYPRLPTCCAILSQMKASNPSTPRTSIVRARPSI